MRLELAFGQTNDDRFLVLAKMRGFPADDRGNIWSAVHDHEDIFLERAVEAKLDRENLCELIVTVLLSISTPVYPPRWVELDLDETQRSLLGFPESDFMRPIEFSDAETSANTVNPFGFEMDPGRFSDMLLRSPTPFVVLAGPEHRLVFGNAPYMRIMGYEDPEEVIGKTIREILPELEGQPFFRLLADVYRTGTPFVGKEVKANIRAHRDKIEESYFDFVYHPMRDSFGEVVGILAQAADVTGRVLARTVSQHREELLYSQWSELDAIYRMSPVGMCLIDAATFRILRINQKQAELMGATIEELMGQNILEVASHLPDFAKLVNLAAKSRGIRNTVVEEDVRRSGRAAQSWLVNMTPMLGVAGELTTIASIFLEISRASFAESGLEASNDLVSDVLQNMGDGVYVLDHNWKIVYLNARARDILAEGENLLGLNVWERFPKAVGKLFWKNYQRTMTERVATSFTESYSEPHLRWSEVHAYPCKDGIAVFLRDITKEKLEEEALRESEERYRMMLDLDPQIPWTMSATGMMTDFGKRWSDLSGQSREETLGLGFMNAVHPDDVAQLANVLGAAIAAETSFDVTWRMARKDGIPNWMRSRGTPVFDDGGSLMRWYGTTEDVDELMLLREMAESYQV